MELMKKELNIGKSKTHGELTGEWTDLFFSEEELMNLESNQWEQLKDSSDFNIKNLFHIYSFII